MLFKRKIYDRLLEWKKEASGTTAMLIEGARRIGKSTIVETFAKDNYKSYVLIDFSKTSDTVKRLFYDYLDDLDTFFMILSTIFHVDLQRRESLIIFDEIQLFPKAREALKHLVKDGRYDFIETGSLISIKENTRNILIPSEEESVRMYPLDFEEFAWALNEKKLLDLIKGCFERKTALPEPLHRQAMLLFKEYLLVGGMPKAVSGFLDGGKQFALCASEQRKILKTYRDDIGKIAPAYRSKVLSIFDQIPGFLSSHEKRVKINSLNPSDRALNYEDTFFWLADSMICNECFLCNDPNIGLSLNERRAYIKCYMGDTGLLLCHAFDESERIEPAAYEAIMTDKLSINKGMLYENLIAQMLVSNGHKLYFYTHYDEKAHHNDMEIDFLISSGPRSAPKIIPIEVKSGKNYAATSLESFVAKYKKRIASAYIIHPKQLFMRSDGIVCLPPYMAFCL
jgi:uncharacterized protein